MSGAHERVTPGAAGVVAYRDCQALLVGVLQQLRKNTFVIELGKQL